MSSSERQHKASTTLLYSLNFDQLRRKIAFTRTAEHRLKQCLKVYHGKSVESSIELHFIGYTDLMVDGAPLPHQPDTTLRWLIDRLRS